ncbi:N5-carboxyaminoimidazole ribonucleotide synthase [Synechococcus sp. MIT S9509]|uniref:5-(carboxyamino)imidazole ribonucleotide synthase n=1 Tax=Synechococcus sp. MIT S9509 TaxID=1801630 RepID=UPI0007BC3216|nr:5-(carboxyamino)imidazole ribonucleotide synthase [Synechococcus sp. MIT S9509]KZR92289.1 N5-carboxyaminoimidazole ribonucleotide synthase [Synechococcus sp. MIT S9509]
MASAAGTIGVVGGGQLALMLCEAAQSRNIDVIVQSASGQDPAMSVAQGQVLGAATDAAATAELLKRCQHITFENEWIPVEALQALDRDGVLFSPSLDSLLPLVNKLSQRRMLDDLAIPSPAWIALDEINTDSPTLPSGWTFPVMAKAAHGGYDGKGTCVLADLKSLEELLSRVSAEDWLLEAWVTYERELALVVSRDQQGRIRSLPLVETHQKNQVCDWVLAPAQSEQLLEATAYNIAASLLTSLNYVGVMALEFFYGPAGLMVNEIAPRTHNSGHFSIEACSSSQFDQQLCITGKLPVPASDLVVPGALMVNLLGLSSEGSEPLKSRLSALEAIPRCHLHWYGKEEMPGRKVGHVTVLLEQADSEARGEEAQSLLKQIRAVWPNPLN